jgi:hypothetical protein
VIAARRKAEGEETVETIKRAGGDACFVETDVSQPDQVRAMVGRTIEAYGRLDIAFNNAGMAKGAPLIDMTEEDFDRVIAVNLKGVWLWVKHEIPQMLAGGGGTIVNMSSGYGLFASPRGVSAYAGQHTCARSRDAGGNSRGGPVAVLRRGVLRERPHHGHRRRRHGVGRRRLRRSRDDHIPGQGAGSREGTRAVRWEAKKTSGWRATIVDRRSPEVQALQRALQATWGIPPLCSSAWAAGSRRSLSSPKKWQSRRC